MQLFQHYLIPGLVLIDYIYPLSQTCMTINMAVSANKVASKNSMMILTLRSLTNFLIAAPNAAHGEIDTGQTSKATDAIISTDENKFIQLI